MEVVLANDFLADLLRKVIEFRFGQCGANFGFSSSSGGLILVL